MNLQDVAERAGVSAATASRSLRGLAKVSPDTRQRVIEAARELSYTTALQAAPEFAPGPRKTVAVIVPFITRWFFTTVTAAAVDHLREHGYDVLLYHLGSAGVRDDFFSRMPLAGRVDGILVLSAPLNEEHTLALRALDIPFVTVGTTVPGVPAVGIDAVAAARQAVNHLIHLRHRRIGLIVGEADDPRFEFESSAERRRGCEEALQAAGLTLPEELVATGPHGLEGGAEAMTALLSRPVLPTAVFAEYDELAIGALWALRRAGLSVPRRHLGDQRRRPRDGGHVRADHHRPGRPRPGRDRRTAAAAGTQLRRGRALRGAGATADPPGTAGDDRPSGFHGDFCGAQAASALADPPKG